MPLTPYKTYRCTLWDSNILVLSHIHHFILSLGDLCCSFYYKFMHMSIHLSVSFPAHSITNLALNWYLLLQLIQSQIHHSIHIFLSSSFSFQSYQGHTEFLLKNKHPSDLPSQFDLGRSALTSRQNVLFLCRTEIPPIAHCPPPKQLLFMFSSHQKLSLWHLLPMLLWIDILHHSCIQTVYPSLSDFSLAQQAHQGPSPWVPATPVSLRLLA